jgi:hypothetical protein
VSKTGRYRFIDGAWVKVSDRIPSFPDAYVPSGGYYDETLGTQDGERWKPAFIHSKEQKASIMGKRGLVEDGGFKPVVRRKYFNA